MLTDDEIQAIHDTYHRPVGRQAFARAIEAAVLSKLASGVSVEPDYQRLVYKATGGDRTQYPEDYRDYYTLETLNTAIAAARVQERERIAKEFDGLYTFGGDEIGKAIRALKEAT